MIVPWALVLRIREERMLKHCKVAFDGFKWDDVRVVGQSSITILKLGHELGSVVPCAVIAKVLLDQTESHLAFLLNKWLLSLLEHIFRNSNCVFLQESFNHPESVVPAVEIPFVHF